VSVSVPMCENVVSRVVYLRAMAIGCVGGCVFVRVCACLCVCVP